MHCLADTDLIQLVDGSLHPDVAEALEQHIDRCEHCFATVAYILRGHSAVHQRQNSVQLALPPPHSQLPSSALENLEIGRRYLVLALIGQGGMGQVYRALDRLTGKAVALKRVLRRSSARLHFATATFLSEEPAFYARCLEQEFRILATLRHPNIISVLDYGFDDQLQPFFTMELLDGARPILPFARALPQPARIDLVIQLLHALGYLHQRGVLHRDIKPSNLLVVPTPQRGLVLKVLDFGLSSGREEPKLSELAGTLSYMAPELLRHQSPSTASDLYAVGMVAYELLAGSHPFAAEGGRTTRLLFKTLLESPDLSCLPIELRHVIGRALSKQPEARPADVASFLGELCTAAGVGRPEESSAVRDSFLIAARFVGREAELAALSQALADAQKGHGAAWLLGGESGSGKSRLLDELRSLALITGVVVARGQAISEGGTAFQIWQEVLQVLVLHVELHDQEASVLEMILPGLATLLERPIAAPPEELDAQAARLQRLRMLRQIVLRIRRPVLILLEDLHWADAESLALLAQLSSAVSSHSMLIIASYRNDEAPQLPDTLPSLQVLPIGRLQRHEMEQLCESMLGSASRNPDLLDLIDRETEGNAFFIVEVVRALAEEAGELGEIGRRGLPQQLFVGGVEQVLARRLQRVPADARGLLQMAAVMGRQLDLEVLATLCPDRDALVQQCAASGVLSVQEQRWRFSHDKLREQLLAKLSSADQQTLHARIAEAIEHTYPASAVPAAQLARHYHQAQRSAKAVHYYALAGAASLSGGAPADAAALLENAVTLQNTTEVPLLTRVQVWRRLAQARYSLGELHATDHALRQVCTLVGRPLPTESWTLGVDLLRQAAVRFSSFARTARKRPSMQDSESAQELDRELLLALMVEEIYVWLSQPGLTLLCSLRGFELAEALNAAPQRTYFRAAVAFLLSFTPLGSMGLRYLEPAPSSVGTTAEIDSLRTRTIVELHRGHSAQASESATRAVALAREHKDDFALMSSLLQQQLALIELEDFAQVYVVSCELEKLAIVAQNPRYRVVAQIGQLGSFLRHGQLDRAEELCARTDLQDLRDIGAVPESVLHGLAAMCAVKQRQTLRARQRADRALDAVLRARWPLLQLRYALMGILDAYLNVNWEDFSVTEMPSERTEQALGILRRNALQFTSMRPASALYKGRYSLLCGHRDRALRQLHQSVRAAHRHGTRFDQAMAHAWLGWALKYVGRIHDHGVHADAEAHLHTARTLFENLGASGEAEHIRRAVEGKQ